MTTFYLAGLAGTGSISLTDTNSIPGSSFPVTLSVGSSGASSTFNGALSGSGGLTVSAGTLVLGGPNSYSGTTAVTASTLKLDFSQPGAPSKASLIMRASIRLWP